MATEIVLTNDSVLQFLNRFEDIAAKENFDLIEDMVHDRAFFRFNDGDFKGKAAVRGAFEKTWKGSANVRKERFYLTDIEAERRCAQCHGHLHLQLGRLDGRAVLPHPGSRHTRPGRGEWPHPDHPRTLEPLPQALTHHSDSRQAFDRRHAPLATIREGTNGVLLVVDVQVGVMKEAWEAARVINNVARAIERAREQAVPVIWVQHSADDLAPGTPEWKWVPQLVRAASEVLIAKQFNSAFEETSLEAELARLGATHIALVGAATNWCIRATAYGALDRGYDLTLVKDAHTTDTLDLGNGRTVEAATVVDDLNVAMTWLCYPGRKNGTATAEEVDFATPGGGR